jgi:hypothetical protein
MTYACPAWEFAADTYLLKLQRLQYKVLRTIGNFPRHTPVRDLHVVSKFRMFMTLSQNYAGNKQKSFRIVTIQMFAT